MNNIESFINYVADDFIEYVDKAESLCELSGLNYMGYYLPNYQNIHVQQLYLLRYAYAYSYEYMWMYRQVLEKLRDVPQVSIVSVGCGSMLDYWSLVQAMTQNNCLDKKINYVGIDTVEWNYRFGIRKNDQLLSYLHNDAVKCFQNNPKFVSDIYFFAKSISEFSMYQIGEIAQCFEKKEIEKDHFFLCVSMRNTNGKREEDMEKTKVMVKSIERNGFRANPGWENYYAYNESERIEVLDKNYYYPEYIKQCIISLNDKCKKRSYMNCNCNLSRNPILKTGQVCYQIVEFERRKTA